MIYNEKDYKAKIPYDCIDAEIVDIIRDLNKYEKIATGDSCAGHIRNNKFVNPSINLIFWKYELLREFIMRFLLIRWVPENDFFNINMRSWENWIGVPEGTCTLSIYATYTEKITCKQTLESIRKEFFSRVKVVLMMLDCPLFQSESESCKNE